MKSIIILSLTVFSALAIAHDGVTTRPADRLGFRLVAQDENVDRNLVEELPDPADRSRNLLVFREVLLNASDVDSARTTRQTDGRQVITLTMTSDGAAKLREVTGKNIDRQIAFVLDGRVLIAPVIRSEISRQVVVDLGPSADVAETLAVCKQIEDAIAAAKPTTRP